MNNGQSSLCGTPQNPNATNASASPSTAAPQYNFLNDPTGLCGHNHGATNSSGNTAMDAYSARTNYDPTGGTGDSASIFGSTKNVVPYSRDYNDPLGINAQGQMAPSGGPEMRSNIYDAITGAWPNMEGTAQDSIDALRSAAYAPGYQDAAQGATDTINGKYLNGSPQLDALIDTTRANTNAQVADNNARTNEEFSRGGQGFSTANQQAQNNAQSVANRDSAAMEAGTRYQNYATERQNQNNGANLLNEATGAPINYLSQVNSARLQPLSAIAQIVSGLSGGASTSYNPQDVIEQESPLRSMLKDVNSV